MCTPLSNFEAALNYKEVSDPSVIVQFKRTDKKDSWILAWTTTPWTLPSNLALCVHPELTYLRLQKKDDGQEWIVGKDRFDWICSCIKKDAKKDFKVLEEFPGQKLVGTTYEPLFPYFKGKTIEDKCWRVVSDTYVTTGAGTCIVHQAPAFGEDDGRVCKKYGIVERDGTGMVDPVDVSGRFGAEVSDFVGQHVKEADKGIIAKLKAQGSLVYAGSEVHNYPHCWRSDTPLIYKAIPAWFIKVEDIRDKLIANNNQTYWVPSSVKEKRFHNWLSEARDWGVSRTRYWGTPLPLWVSDDFEEIVCIGSVAELEKHAGRKITDLHRHFIDDIKIPSKKGKGMLKRVDEVFDCWFESGAMPYAHQHYPFENKKKFEAAFPANFIAEGLDQTRGWFYSLMVISTIIFDKPPWKNLIVNGLVLAADGKKMSKRLQNYPAPQLMCDKYGADAVRMYMLNSPVVRAEPLKFKEDGVKDVVKDVFLPWYHAYRFFVGEATRYENEGFKFVPDSARIKKSTNFMDKWINAATHNLIKFVREEMEAYRLYTVVGGLTKLLEDMTNWYIRLNRDRMKGDQGPEETLTALCTLYEVILNVTIMLAAITPFITEMIYQNLARALPEGHPLKAKSVHFLMIPEYDSEALDADTVRTVQRMQQVVELGRLCREQKKVGMKTPLRSLTLYRKDEEFLNDVRGLELYVQEELNVMFVEYSTDTEKITLTPTLNFKALGKKLGKDMKAVHAAVGEISQAELTKFEEEGKITVLGYEINSEEMSLARTVTGLDDPNLHHTGDAQTMVVMDFTFDENLARMKLAREIANRVQKLRKESRLQPDDPVDMWVDVVGGRPDSGLGQVVVEKSEYIDKHLRKRLWRGEMRQGHEVIVGAGEYDDIGEEKVRLTLTSRTVFFNTGELKKIVGGDAAAEAAIRQYLSSFALERLTAASKKGDLKFNFSGKAFSLKCGKHFSLGPGEASWLK